MSREEETTMAATFSQEDERRRALIEEMFRTHFTAVHRYISRQIQQPDLAADLTSLVFLKALRWLREDRGIPSVRSWLYAAARTTMAEYWQEQQRSVSLPLEMIEDSAPAPLDKGDERRTQERVKRLLHLLSERDRQVLFLRYFRGYSAAEIGQELGVSAAHVRVLHLRALRHAALLEAQERSLLLMDEPVTTYTEQGQRVLDLAKQEALSLDHHHLGAEHLLLGVLREGSLAAPNLTPYVEEWATLERVRAGVIYMEGKGQPEPGEDTPFTPGAQQVLTRAGEAARDRGERAISPSHILQALAYEEHGLADALLHSLGVRGSSPGSLNKPSLNENETEHYVRRMERQIEQTPALSEEEELRLAHLVARGRAEQLKEAPDPLIVEEGEAAYFQLNPASQHLVLSVAKEYSGLGRDLRHLCSQETGALPSLSSRSG
jgi:RNA polymerase sigma factor (sigma-70 family)